MYMNCTCGLDKTKTPCSMEECTKRKQVRYWGLKTVDSRILDTAGSPKDLAGKRMKLISERIKNKAALKKLKDKILYTNTRKDEKEKIRKEAEKYIEKLKNINTKLVKLNKIIEEAMEKKGGNLSTYNTYMRSYCIKQKKVTECVPGSERYQKTKNGRTMMKCTCAECGITKTKFVKGKGN